MTPPPNRFRDAYASWGGHTATGSLIPATASGSCPHTHTTGIHCPAPASHDLPHDLPHGCTDCNVPGPGLDEDGRSGLLHDLFDAYGAPLPDDRIMTALTQALAATYQWGWNDGYDEGAVTYPTPEDDEGNPQ